MNPLELLEDPLRALLDFLHENVDLTYGWSIVMLTVIVRLALLPLVIKQYSSMRRMQMYAPQMKELQQKYKGNRQKLNEELMAFYKENEINPFSSCLPLVAQLPIFIALYYVLRDFANDADVTQGAVSFMWVIPDVRTDFTEIGWGAAVIVVIYAASQLLSTELSTTPNMPQSQRRLMRILPLGVVAFLFMFPVPAGLVLYWMTTNLWTAGQQLVMRHRIGLHLADPEQVEAMKKKGSRTAPAEPATAVAAVADAGPAEQETEEPAPAKPRLTPRRRRKAAAAENGAAEAAPEPAAAPEPQTAPEPEEAPEPATTDEAPADEAPAGAAADGATGNGAGETAPEAAPSGAGSGSGARRRQPRQRGTAKGSRPAPSKSKKRRR